MSKSTKEFTIKVLIVILLMFPMFWFGFGQRVHIGSFVIEYEVKPLKRFFK